MACAASSMAIAAVLFPQAAQAACNNITANDVECSGPNPNINVNNSGAGARATTVTQGANVSSGTQSITMAASYRGRFAEGMSAHAGLVSLSNGF